MKQKYEILWQGDKLVIKEFAELDKEMMSLLCEESYDRAAIGDAVSEGAKSVMAAIRTKNMYPPSVYAAKLSEAIAEMFASQSDEPVEVVINDLDLLARRVNQAEADIDDSKEEDADIDDLLDDDVDPDDLLDDDVDPDEDSLEDEIAVKKIKSSLKVADDEVADIDDDL